MVPQAAPPGSHRRFKGRSSKCERGVVFASSVPIVGATSVPIVGATSVPIVGATWGAPPFGPVPGSSWGAYMNSKGRGKMARASRGEAMLEDSDGNKNRGCEGL